MKQLLLSITLLATFFLGTSAAQNFDPTAYQFCNWTHDPKPPQSVNPSPGWTYNNGPGLAISACFDVDYVPSWDHDNNTSTPKLCWPGGVGTEGTEWIHFAIAWNPDGSIKKCSSYFKLPEKRCTSQTGLTGAAGIRNVARLGATNPIYLRLSAMGLDPADFCKQTQTLSTVCPSSTATITWIDDPNSLLCWGLTPSFSPNTPAPL